MIAPLERAPSEEVKQYVDAKLVDLTFGLSYQLYHEMNERDKQREKQLYEVVASAVAAKLSNTPTGVRHNLKVHMKKCDDKFAAFDAQIGRVRAPVDAAATQR